MGGENVGKTFRPRGPTAIGAFHSYHTLLTLRALGGEGLNREDLVHHLVSGIGVPAIGVCMPFGRLLSLVNFFMCGVPGGVDYALLVAVKYGVIGRMREKRVNRMLNLVLRMPGMQLAAYLFPPSRRGSSSSCSPARRCTH